MMVLGTVITLGSAFVVPVLGLPLSWIGICIVVGEIIAFGAIPALGMVGFKEIKNRLFSILHLPSVETLKPVSRARHVLGLVLVFGSLLFQWTAAMLIIIGFSAASQGASLSTVFGVPFEDYRTTFLTIVVAAELSILIGLFTLGGLWWERFRQLFLWPDRARRLR